MANWTSIALSATTEKNPLCAAAALATLEVLESEQLAQRADEHGRHISQQLSRAFAASRIVAGFEAAGMMYSVRFSVGENVEATAAFVQRIYRHCIERGLLPMPPRGTTLAFSGPLIANKDEVDEALRLLVSAIEAAASD